jgi:phytoene dehydrogenase-like protein
MTIYSEYIVIGAGASGLAVTNMLAKDNREVLCLEAHSLVGGCASFFRRKKMIFDVGATTLSGMKYDGPLKKFIEEFNIDVKLKHIDPGLCIHLNNKEIYRHANLEDWIKELQINYPGFEKYLIKTWNEIEKINEVSWNSVSLSKYFPINSLRDLTGLIRNISLDKFLLLKTIFGKASTYTNINNEYLKLIDQLLLIAAQNTSVGTNRMVSTMALSYLNDTWYCYGGIGEFTKQMSISAKNYGASIVTNSKVTNIKKENGYFYLSVNDKEYKCKSLISSIPIWNTKNILEKSLSLSLNTVVKKHDPKWGAITGYFRIKLRDSLKTIYHQVHTDTGSYFFSFSMEDDDKRNSDGFQTLTISTHIDLKDSVLAKEEYEGVFNDLILKHFNPLELETMGIGTPYTFEKFTSRVRGSVGGIPQVSFPLFHLPKSKTSIDNLFLLGDTTFPGQGIVGVIQGAYNLVYRL